MYNRVLQQLDECPLNFQLLIASKFFSLNEYLSFILILQSLQYNNLPNGSLASYDIYIIIWWHIFFLLPLENKTKDYKNNSDIFHVSEFSGITPHSLPLQPL